MVNCRNEFVKRVMSISSQCKNEDSKRAARDIQIGANRSWILPGAVTTMRLMPKLREEGKALSLHLLPALIKVCH